MMLCKYLGRRAGGRGTELGTRHRVACAGLPLPTSSKSTHKVIAGANTPIRCNVGDDAVRVGGLLQAPPALGLEEIKHVSLNAGSNL